MNKGPLRPLLTLPEDVKNLSVVLKQVGGLGDVVIAAGSAANTLSQAGAKVTLAVKENQISFVRQLKGVSDSISATKLNSQDTRQKYDVYLDFYGLFANAHSFRKKDYYRLVEERIKRKVQLAEFVFPSVPKEKTIGIHPNATSPNRRWGEDRFDQIAKVFMGNGWGVIWLGSADEFGYSSQKSEKLSDTSNELSYQVQRLAECSYFLGNDSGFCHCAGILNIPGKVIFSNTNPEHVISRYAKLSPITAFDQVPNTPTYSLTRNDPKSLECLDKITVERVLEQLPFLDKTKVFTGQTKKKKPILRIKGQFPPKLILRLTSLYEISHCRDDETEYLTFDPQFANYHKEDKVYTISADYDALENALRNILAIT